MSENSNGAGRQNTASTSKIDRRKFLGGLGGATALGLAGCVGGDGDGGDGDEGGGATATGTKVGNTEEFGGASVKLSLDWIPNGTHSGFFYAARKGFWAEHKLDVQIARGFGSPETAQEVHQGAAQFGFVSLASGIQAINKGLNITSVAPFFYQPLTVIYSTPEGSVQEPKDLEGKKAIVNAGLRKAQLTTLFSAMGLDLSKVELETRQFSEATVLLSGDADWKMETADAFVLLSEAEDFSFDYHDWVKDNVVWQGENLMVNKNYLENNRETVRRFVDGAIRGYTEALANQELGAGVDELFEFFPEQAVGEAEELPLTAKELRLTEAKATAAAMFTPETKEHGLGYAAEGSGQKSIDIVEEHLIEGSVAFDDVFAGFVESGQYPLDWDASVEGLQRFGPNGKYPNIALQDEYRS